MIDLALRGHDRQRIAQGLGREPTRVELHAFDAQWSEHCSYKSSRALLRRLPTKGAYVVLGPGEDAGILHLGVHDGERYAIVVAHESHNHPSQVVPFEGAATGVGGIVRDVLCMGAEVVGLADALRFGDVRDAGSHQRHVAQAVVDGIGAYGNAIGVPNIAGDVAFHKAFDDNCLVNVIALGVVKERDVVRSFAPRGSVGWPLILVGKATDASGFGGAAFSSATLDPENEAANKSAVQVPDPFLKNVLMRATYRVLGAMRERGIEIACKDLGAGGVMGCSAELCAAGGFGARIDLDTVNATEPGLPAEVLAVGETQERLLLVVPPEAATEVLHIYNEEFSLPNVAYNARATVVGEVTEERRYVLVHRAQTVMDVDIGFLTAPPELDAAPTSGVSHAAPVVAGELGIREALRSLDACSRAPLFERYDGVVRGCTVLPRGYADAGVIAPVIGSPLGVVLAVAGDATLAAANPRLAAEAAVSEAVRKVVAVGAVPIGLTDCLNFGNPQNPDHFRDLADAVEGLAEAARRFGLPFVSGNVSLYNENASGRAIAGSAIVSCVGRVDDIERCVTPSLKRAGSVLAVADATEHVLRAMERGHVRACTAVGADRAGAAIARMAFAALREDRVLGADLDCVPTNAGFVVELAEPSDGFVAIGAVTKDPFLTLGAERHNVKSLYGLWSEPLREIYP